ncbi:MAG: hypothetical protein J0H12_06800 [Candidatus Paracaedimonas acanthamoebae]|uniref:HTH luxR-type domain-containing protein n=1 Tax=Candidatus Paracaedimonas acanthamoebae TaxID=244581 RepID=A0A8J7PKR3_9PROT|nr:hypothetical protein [Candidatus Paracaedimonas acanthamoebae]
MQFDKIGLTNNFYVTFLSTIEGINFSQREIDIIVCLLTEKSSKEIASFLAIMPRTIDNYLYNIGKRINAKTRKDICEFMRKSHQFSYLSNYYTILSFQIWFEKKLSELSKLIKKPLPSCIILSWDAEKHKIELLKKHLEIIGFEVSIKTNNETEQYKNFSSFSNSKIPQEVFSLFIMSELQSKSFLGDKKEVPKNIFFLQEENENSLFAQESLELQHIINFSNYYFCIIAILKKMVLTDKFSQKIALFEKEFINYCTENFNEQARQYSTKRILKNTLIFSFLKNFNN